jgi:hypothetical protein
MAPPKGTYTPNLTVFLKALKEQPIESSIEYLISFVHLHCTVLSITNTNYVAASSSEGK